MNLSDVETILAIQENPYMQYFVGLSEFTDNSIFGPSLFVSLRKRLGTDDFNEMILLLMQLSSEDNDQSSAVADDSTSSSLNETQISDIDKIL